MIAGPVGGTATPPDALAPAQPPQRLRIEGVSKRFGDVQALDDVSLDVRAGELVSILGASGCGKSTLLRVVAGLEDADGSVTIGDHPVDALAPKERGVAFVFQSYALYPQMSVAGNIAAPLVMGSLTAAQRLPFVGRWMPGTRARRREIDARVRATAELLQIETLLGRRPSALSGGQRQRVALARALIREPRLFLLDEPLANLDAALRQQTRSELRALQQRLGTTMLFVTHDQAEAMALSDRIAVMFAGRIRQFGTPDELYRWPVDLDVARFLSQPVLNTFRGRCRSERGVEAAGAVVAVDGARRGAGVLAFRPQNAELAEAGAARGIPVVVERTEHAGADAHVVARTLGTGEACTIRVPSARLDRWRAGVRATLAIDAAAAWFFPDAAAPNVVRLETPRRVPEDA